MLDKIQAKLETELKQNLSHNGSMADCGVLENHFAAVEGARLPWVLVLARRAACLLRR